MYYTGLGQSLATDPYQYVFHARNKILSGEADPYDYPRWTVYEHSLTSLAAYIWFSIAGVSMKNANMVGVVLSLGGLLFLCLGLARHHRPWVVAATALCYGINITLITYGRLPYLENGLVFIAGLLFFVYARFGDRAWGLIVSGALVALATFTGKLFGVLLLPALMLAVFLSPGPGRVRRTLPAAGAFVVAGAVVVLALYGRDITVAFSYAGEQAYGIKGFPAGLMSPWGFFEHLVWFGFKNRLFYRSPDLLMFLLCGGFMLAVFVNTRERLKGLPPTTRLSLIWAAVVYLGLMPHAYSPVRYSLLLIPAIIISVFTLADHLLGQKKIAAGRLGITATILLTLLFWFGLYQVVANVFYFNITPYRLLAWATLPGGILLALAARYLAIKQFLRLSRRTLVAGIVAMVALSAVTNAFRIRRLDYLEHNFNIREACEDVGCILGPDAIISGPYAPALTIDNEVKSFIYLFGVAEVDSTLFDRFPITHLAVDISNFNEAVASYPQLAQAPVVARYWIRDYEVMLLNISEIFANPRARAYQESGYETAAEYIRQNNVDSALVELARYRQFHPVTKSVGRLLAECFWRTGRYEESMRSWERLAAMYPTDFHIQLSAGQAFLAAGMLSGNQALTGAARRYMMRGVQVNRYRGDYANRIYSETMQTFEQQRSGGEP